MKRIILFFIIIFLILFSQYVINIVSYHDMNIVDEYKKVAKCTDGFIDWHIFNVYYYDSNKDHIFTNNINYKVINNSNIDTVKSLFAKKYIFDNSKCKKIYNTFDINTITVGDYVVLNISEYDDFSVYFYDIDNHILYYFNNKT